MTWSLESLTIFVGRLRRLPSQASSGSDSATTLEVGIGSSPSIQHARCNELGKTMERAIFVVLIPKCSNRIWVYFSKSFTFIINIHQYFWIASVFFHCVERDPPEKPPECWDTWVFHGWFSRVLPWLGTGCRGSVWYTMAPVPWICRNDIQWHHWSSCVLFGFWFQFTAKLTGWSTKVHVAFS